MTIKNFNIDPYYDDFDESKNFHKILFRPGYAVQARELTQLQTILQNQIKRYGDYIFKSGSLVSGGEISYSRSVKYLRLNTLNKNGETIDVNDFSGKIIANETSFSANGGIAKVLTVDDSDSANGPTLIVQYTTASSVSNFTIGENSIIYTLEENREETKTANTISTSHTGESSVINIKDGIYFIQGYFVKIEEKTIALDTFGNTPSYRIGFNIDDSIITEKQDISLLDPALEASNFQAPGAARYIIKATLEKRTLDSADDTSFIEIARIENGILSKTITSDPNSILENSLAKRTYDHAGNFTVKHFDISLRKNTSNTFTAVLGDGKAYINGYEFKTISPTNITIEKARDKEIVENKYIYTSFGNYFVANSVSGFFNIDELELVDLHKVYANAIDKTNSSSYANTKIGTARVYQIDFDIASNTDITSTYNYNIYLTDLRFTSNNISEFRSIVANTPGTPVTFTANADVSFYNINSGNAFLSDTNLNKLLFRIPESFIAFDEQNENIARYRGKRIWENQTPTNYKINKSLESVYDFFVGNGFLSNQQKTEHFMIVKHNTGEVVSMTSNGRTIEVDDQNVEINLANITESVDIIATVDYKNAKTNKLITKNLKTANTNTLAISGGIQISTTNVYSSYGQIEINSPNKIQGESDNLYISDIFKLDGKFEKEYGYFTVKSLSGNNVKSSFKVIENPQNNSDLINPEKDITYRYSLDNGQRDTFYDHGKIILNAGMSAPSGKIVVLVNWFDYDDNIGFFSCDSYNVGSNLNYDGSGEIYAKIPVYISQSDGTSYNLRDCIDFRPVRENATESFSLRKLASIPKEDQYVESTYEYYLPRKDRIVLNKERKIQRISGISDLYPQTPKEPENSMTLYTISIPPYTFFPSDCDVKYFENKRYTMRDIGKLEKRIENLEYYSSLNFLEKQASDLTILDEAGFERFKNGILVDPFVGHSIGDVKNFDHYCSIDTTKKELRPSFRAESLNFTMDEEESSTYTAIYALNSFNTNEAQLLTSGLIDIHKPIVSQLIYSSSISLNPFLDTSYVGTVELSPDGDVWVDRQKNPEVLINLTGSNDSWEAIGQELNDVRESGWGLTWNDWQTVSQGVPVSTETQYNELRSEGFLTYEDTYSRTTAETNTTQTRSTQPFNVYVPETIITNLGNRQVDLSVIPYIREQQIEFFAKNLVPNRAMYFNFDNIDVKKYIEQASTLIIHTTSGGFRRGEIITSTSGGSAKVLAHLTRTWASTFEKLFVIPIEGQIKHNDIITGSITNNTANVELNIILGGKANSATSTTIVFDNGSEYDNVFSNFANTINTQITSNNIIINANTNISIAGQLTENQFNDSVGYNKIRIVSGKGKGQNNIITSYDSSSNTATLNTAWTIIPDSTSRYAIGNIGTSETGLLYGVFYLPEETFTTGAKKFRISDNYDENNIKSFAEETFYAQGLRSTTENISVSTKGLMTQTKSIEENRNLTNSVTTNNLLGSTLVSDNTPIESSPEIFAPAIIINWYNNDDLLIWTYTGDSWRGWDGYKDSSGNGVSGDLGIDGYNRWDLMYIGKNYTGIDPTAWRLDYLNQIYGYNRAAQKDLNYQLVPGSTTILTKKGQAPQDLHEKWITQYVEFTFGGYAGNDPRAGQGNNWTPLSWGWRNTQYKGSSPGAKVCMLSSDLYNPNGFDGSTGFVLFDLTNGPNPPDNSSTSYGDEY